MRHELTQGGTELPADGDYRCRYQEDQVKVEDPDSGLGLEHRLCELGIPRDTAGGLSRLGQGLRAGHELRFDGFTRCHQRWADELVDPRRGKDENRECGHRGEGGDEDISDAVYSALFDVIGEAQHHDGAGDEIPKGQP